MNHLFRSSPVNDLTCLGHWIEDDLTFLIAKADLEKQPYCYVLSNRYDSEMVRTAP